MSFPQYHEPQVPFDGTWLWVPIVLGLIAVLILILTFSGPLSKKPVADGWLPPMLFMFVLVGTVFTAVFLVGQVNLDKQVAAEDRAEGSYHSKIAAYIDDTYGVKISNASAAELVRGEETAGTDPAGETITLSLLNRDQKEPVLIGTDHNPIPKFEKIGVDLDE